jgi:hypothetical protein
MLSAKFEPELDKLVHTWSSTTPAVQCRQDVLGLIAYYQSKSAKTFYSLYPETKRKVQHLLKVLKLPVKTTGYPYLLAALVLAVEEPERLDFPYIDLFSEVARLYEVSSNVLSTMSTALRGILQRPANAAFLDEQFLPYRSFNTTRATLDFFVEIMAEYIRSDLPL